MSTKALFWTASFSILTLGAAYAQDSSLGEIVITAQKREQSLQDVPISVNAFSADYISTVGADTVGQLQNFTPGLSVDDSSITQPKFSIRGVQTDDFGVGTDPAVAIFVDGVYSARSGAALVFFNDIERVEVLKGPQGTLFGRNTAAGAISIITKKPDQERMFRLMGRLGNYNAHRIEATANLPITNSFAMRFNIIGNEREGFLTNRATGEDLERDENLAFRAAARWQPSAATDVNIAWDHDSTSVDGPPAIGIGPFADNGGDPFAGFDNDVVKSREVRRLDGLTLTIEHDAGPVTLTSVSGYKHFVTRNREDEDGTDHIDRYFDTDNREDNDNFYQEFRVGGLTDTLKWTAGLSYYWEDAQQTSATMAFTDSVDTTLVTVTGDPSAAIFGAFAAGGVPVLGIPWFEDMNNEGEYTSAAFFGDVTWSATSKLNLTVGARYTHDKKKFTWLNGPHSAPGLEAIVLPGSVYNDALGAPIFDPDALIDFNFFYTNVILGGADLIFDVGPLEGVAFRRQDEWENFSPRFVVDYKWTDDIMTYFSVARGYKAGGFNSVEINSQFNPEKVTNVEGGIKAEWLDGRLRTNASVYHYVYEDRQALSLADIPGSTVPQYITITGDSSAWGVDFDAQWLATEGLIFSVSTGFIDAQWDERTESAQVFNDLTDQYESVDFDLSDQPTGEPRLKLVLGGDYTLPLGAGGELRFHVDHTYTSAQRENDVTRAKNIFFEDALGVDLDFLDGYYEEHMSTNARGTWSFAEDKYQISAWVENIFDEQYVQGINDITAATLGTPYTRLTTPRFFGVDATVKF